MTLDEAIKRELDIVKRSERKAAEWLTELKERRKKDEAN